MQLTCSQEIDVSNNKSKIHWTLSSVGGNVNYYSTGPTAIYINGTNVYYKDRVSYTAEVFPAKEGSVNGTIEVAHNEDGSKSIAVGMQTVIYYGAGSSKVYQGTWDLDTIARGVSISGPYDITDKDLPTVYYSNPWGDKASKIELSITDVSGWYEVAYYREVSKTGTSYTFTKDDIEKLRYHTAGEQISNCRYTIRGVANGITYYNHCPFTFIMSKNNPETEPSVTMTLTADNSSFANPIAGVFVQGKSKVKATISAEGKYGATISEYSVNLEGVNNTSADSTITTNAVVTSSGIVPLVGSAVDSRGFTGYVTKEIYVYEYTKPWVVPRGSDKAIQCYRSDDGTPKGSSKSVWVKAKRSYHKLDGNNRCSLQWRVRESTRAWGSQEWYTLISKTDSTKDEYNGKLEGFTFELTKSYSVQIRAEDDVGESDIKEFEIPTQDVALHLGAGGTNVSIGEYCEGGETHTFRSAWKAIFDKGIYGTFYGKHFGAVELKDASDIETLAHSCDTGFTPFYTGESTTGLPTGNYSYSPGFVLKRLGTQMTVVLFDYATGEIAIKTCKDNNWGSWRFIHTTIT